MPPRPPTPPVRMPMLRGLIVRAPGAVVPTAVAPPTSPDAAARAAQLVREVIALRDRIGADFYSLGEKLRELSKPEMYGALGFGSFEELLTKHEIVSRATAAKLIQIVSELPRAGAQAFGVEKAFAVTKYAEVTETTAAALVRRPGVLIQGEKLRDASARAILRAATNVRAKKKKTGGGKARTTTPAENEKRRAANAAANEVMRALRARGATGARARAIRESTGWIVVIKISAEHASMITAKR